MFGKKTKEDTLTRLLQTAKLIKESSIPEESFINLKDIETFAEISGVLYFFKEKQELIKVKGDEYYRIKIAKAETNDSSEIQENIIETNKKMDQLINYLGALGTLAKNNKQDINDLNEKIEMLISAVHEVKALVIIKQEEKSKKEDLPVLPTQ